MKITTLHNIQSSIRILVFACLLLLTSCDNDVKQEQENTDPIIPGVEISVVVSDIDVNCSER